MIDPAHLRPKDRAARIFARAVWVILSLALLAYVACFARNIPYMDDWELVPTLAGASPFNLGWLLELSQEHRYILGKVLLYPIFQLSGGDFRGAMWISALILIALSYAYQRVAQSLRGRAAFTDAFFPLALLHWGHYENLIFFVQLWFVLPVALFSIAMLTIATGWWQSRRGALTLSVCAMLLPLGEAIGLLLAPALAGWMAYAAWNRRATMAIARPLFIASVVTLMFVALYFVHYQTPVRIDKVARTLPAMVNTALEVFGVSFGPGAPGLWPFPGIGVIGLCCATGIGLGIIALRRSEERLRATGLAACLVAVGVLALSISYGRSVFGPGAGNSSRYCLLMVPALCLIFLATILYCGKFRGRLVEIALFSAVCAMFWINVRSGVEYAHYRDKFADALLADIADGIPPAAFAQRNFAAIYPVTASMAQRLAMMRSAHVGPYKNAAPGAPPATPSCHEVQLPTRIVASHEVDFGTESANGTGTDPYVVYALPRSLRACGIRIHYSVENPTSTPATTQVFWKLSSADEQFDGIRRNAMLTLPAGEQTQTFWIYAPIDQFRFDPDIRPCKFRLIDVTFLEQD